MGGYFRSTRFSTVDVEKKKEIKTDANKLNRDDDDDEDDFNFAVEKDFYYY